MPPTFLYFVALMIWVPAAVLVWVIAAVLAIFPGLRSRARSLALAMAATFPGVALFQLATAPVLLVLLWGMRLIWKGLEPGDSTTTENPVVIGMTIIVALLAFGLMLVVSVAGFCEGWRGGWVYGAGTPLKKAITDGFPARVISGLWARPSEAGSL